MTDRWREFLADCVEHATDELCWLVDWFDRADNDTPPELVVGTYEPRRFEDELLNLAEQIASITGDCVNLKLMFTEWEAFVPVCRMPSVGAG